MNKKLLIGVMVLVVAIGAIFVSAQLDSEEGESYSELEQPSQPTCNAQTCGLECGGNCGVPKCGCQK